MDVASTVSPSHETVPMGLVAARIL